ncbi:MAG: hypothetical protein K8R41_04205 [Bacteroidales bacterium]|nr:hypothetical protein [Bacteroidales bacterium]
MLQNNGFGLKAIIFTVTIAFMIFSKPLIAQDNINIDTLLLKKHSPKKATLYSAVLPGMGQAYNKKYWKIPVIYAGFGVLSYFIISNRSEYLKFREAYDYVIAGDSTIQINNDYADKYSSDQLLSARDFYRRNMEFSIILSGFWYILNIVDASVDAHLFDYDISDNLSLHIEPLVKSNIYRPEPITGITIRLKF